MAGAPSTIASGLEDAAACTAPALAGFSSLADTHTAITAADFAPSRCPHPRPWHRVPVPAARATLGLRVVWKRVGGVPLSGDDSRYFKGIAELRAEGQGPRKARRNARHVPVWGEGRWQEARETSDDDMHTEAQGTPCASATSRAADTTSLTFVPRKRNGRRQVILPSQPPSTVSAQPAADPSPRRDSSMPTTSSEVLPVEENAEHITKRAKRRLSRRISILPPQDLESPEKRSAPRVFASPTKRRLSYPALSEEPDELAVPPTPGTIIATAAAFEPVLTSPSKPPAETPQKQPSSAIEGAAVDRQSPIIVFDQPVAKIEAESPHAAQRRVSLHNTRRRETLSSAVERTLPASAPLSKSSRRRSLLAPRSSLALSTVSDSKAGRRHTFQPGALAAFLASDRSPSRPKALPAPTSNDPVSDDNVTATLDLSGLFNLASLDSPAPAARAPVQDETVVVDARTNLDIFGSGPPVHTHYPSEDHRVTFDLGDQSKKPSQGRQLSAISENNEAVPEATAATDASLSLPNAANDQTQASQQPEVPELVTKLPPVSVLDEEATTALSHESTPRSLSPDLDVSTDDSRELTDEQRLVSSRPASGELDQSLLLPLPETTEANAVETDDHWQSPTSAELGHLGDLLDTPARPEPIDLSISPDLTVPTGADMELPAGLGADVVDMEDKELFEEEAELEVDAEEDAEEYADEEAGHGEEDDAASPSNTEDQCDSSSPSPSNDEDHVDYTVTAPIHMLTEADEDATATMTMDLDNLAEEQLSAHEDSETEMLRKFVTRVKADKSAKAAAAAEAAAAASALARSRSNLRHKRRSGSTGSAASSSGSPIAKRDSGFASPFQSLDNRVPLGKKDHNMSPSPKKKRKEPTGDYSGADKRTHDLLGKPALDDTSPARPKRRRKKMEADTGSIFNPEFMANREELGAPEPPSGPRRSKRTRSNQTPLKSAATSANNVLSLLPVRLPGSLNLNGEDSHGLSSSSLGLHRNDEKDLAMVTRVNTRKNKGKANHPSVVVAMLMHDDQRTKRGLKSVFDSPPPAQATPGEDKADDDSSTSSSSSSSCSNAQKPTSKASSNKAKTVRWANVLARFQDSDGESLDTEVAAGTEGLVSGLEAPSDAAAAAPERKQQQQQAPSTNVVDTDIAAKACPPASGPVAPAASAPEPGELPETEKKVIPRRTTLGSRLQPPTPRKLSASAASAAAKASALPTAAGSTTDGSITTGLKGPSAAVSAKRMATRRAKIVGMGMAGNGTPAPKRRATRTT